MKNLLVILVFVLFIACGSETLPKPKPYLKLSYPTAEYVIPEINCPFNLEISKEARFKLLNNCWASIEYPKLKAIVHITYRPVENNLNEILTEVEKLTYEHTVKASSINVLPYEDLSNRVFAKLYNVEGNVATNMQFRVTDSVNHVISGALYFYSRPNYDSLVPAIKYIEKDIVHLVETISWKNNNEIN